MSTQGKDRKVHHARARLDELREEAARATTEYQTWLGELVNAVDAQDVCIFRRKLDGDSDGNWTPIPTETGHGFRRKVDGDSERKWYTFERGLGISTRELQRDVRGAG